MACRELESLDLVRLVDKDSPLHGRNGTVLVVDGNCARVQFKNGEGPTTCIWAHVDNLLVRHEPKAFIYDGQVDHVKKEAHEASIRQKEYLQKELDKAASIQYNPNRLIVTDDYDDKLDMNFGKDWVTFDMFGEQLVFVKEDVQDIVSHLQKFLNQ
jgi:hypothetical protein